MKRILISVAAVMLMAGAAQAGPLCRLVENAQARRADRQAARSESCSNAVQVVPEKPAPQPAATPPQTITLGSSCANGSCAPARSGLLRRR